MSHTFDASFQRLLGEEGAYVNNPADKGGATNWGITERTARASGYTGDMRELTQDQAKTIYKAQYWDTLSLDQVIDSAVAYAMFDTAVNVSPHWAAITAQAAVGVNADAKIGPVSLNAINAAKPKDLIQDISNARIDHRIDVCQRDPGQKVFLLGWLVRDRSLCI